MMATNPTNEAHWAYFQSIAEPALAVAPREYLANIRASQLRNGIPIAVRRRDTAAIYDSLIGASVMQGISDKSAATFTARNGLVGWDDIQSALSSSPTCPRLASYWAYSGCSYRKGEYRCSSPQHLDRCTVPDHPTRKGSLIVAAHSLFLFIRDVCDGDFVGWLDNRLASADPGLGDPDRAMAMGSALLEALRQVEGLGDKVWSMALADLLLAGDPRRERWVTAGAGMVVIDSLLHNFLHRTGVLRRLTADHLYGPRCYEPGGCSDLFRGLAQRIDARQFNPNFPASFPRFVQFAVWRLCSTSELSICNGLSIDDSTRCRNDACPAFQRCDRIPLYDAAT